MTIDEATAFAPLGEAGLDHSANPAPSSSVDTSASTEEINALSERWLMLNRAGISQIGSNLQQHDTSGGVGGVASSPPRRPNQLVTGLKKWVGIIRDIDDGMFTAELSPIDHEGPDMLADFELELLASDASLVTPGDVVYLTTRYVKDRLSYPIATTQIRLRRLGQWSDGELAEIKRRARGYADEFSGFAE
jgi:hypothetical protein